MRASRCQPWLAPAVFFFTSPRRLTRLRTSRQTNPRQALPPPHGSSTLQEDGAGPGLILRIELIRNVVEPVFWTGIV